MSATTGDRHRMRRIFEGLLGVPATEGNRVEALRLKEQAIQIADPQM